jgi:hypothetical protein
MADISNKVQRRNSKYSTATVIGRLHVVSTKGEIPRKACGNIDIAPQLK